MPPKDPTRPDPFGAELDVAPVVKFGPSAPSEDADDVASVYGDTLNAQADAELEMRMRARAMAIAPQQAPPAAKPAQPSQPATQGAPSADQAASGDGGGELPFLEQTGLWLTYKLWGGAQGTGLVDDEKMAGIKATLASPKAATIRAITDDIGRSDILMSGVRGARGALVNAPGSTATLLTGVGNKGVELFNDYLNAPFLDFIGQGGAASIARQWSAEARARQMDVERQASDLTATIDKFVPSAGKAATNTEALVEGITQFVAGFIASKKIAPGKIGPSMTTDVVARGALVNTMAFDPKAPTLANLIGDTFPELKDTWLTATAIETTDSGFEAQMKRAIEGIGLDAATEAIILGAGRFLRSARKADAADAEESGASAAAEVRKAADTAAEAESEVAKLGDASGPDISDAPTPRARMYQGETTPQEQAARVESAVRRAGVLDDRRAGLSMEELDAAYGGGRTYTADQVLDMMDEVKASERPRALLTWVRSQGGIRESADFAGEVASIEAPRVLNRSSKFDLDAMAEKAAEAGYIPYDEFGRHDVNDLIDAMKRDYAAEQAGDAVSRVFSSKDAEAAARLPALLKLESELADLGVNPRMRGPVKRRQAAEEAARRHSGVAFGGEPRTLDDLDALQADMDAAGVAAFRPYDEEMLGPDPVFDQEGLLDPARMAQLSDEEASAVVDSLSDSDAMGSAMAYLDLEAQTVEEARSALLRDALARRQPRGPVVTPEERAALLADIDDLPEERVVLTGEVLDPDIDELAEIAKARSEEVRAELEGRAPMSKEEERAVDAQALGISFDDAMKLSDDEVRQRLDALYGPKGRQPPALRGRQQVDDRSGGPPAGDDVAARMAALRERMADPNVGADNNAMDMQPAAAAEPQWKSAEGKRAMAMRALRMGPDKAMQFVDQMISFASDAEHRTALTEVRQLVENTLNAKFSDNAGDAFGRAKAAARPTRSLRPRELEMLNQVVSAAESGVDPLRQIAAMDVRPQLAREILAHAIADGRLGPWAASRAALGMRGGGMLDGTKLGRVPIEADDDMIVRASQALTPQEFESWKMAALEGMSNPRIAEVIGGADARTSDKSVGVLLSRVRRKGFPVPDGNNVKGPDEVTQRMIDLVVKGVPNHVIADRLYPGVDKARARNRVAVLKNQWHEEIEARRAEVFGDDAKFSDSAGFGDDRASRRIEAVEALEARGVDFFGNDELRSELRRLGVEPRSIGYANAWQSVMSAGGTLDDVLGVVQVTPRTLRQHLRQVAGRLEVAESGVTLARQDLLASDNPSGWGVVEGMGPELAAGRSHIQALADEIVAEFGDEGQALLDSGAVVLHPSADTVPLVIPRPTIAAAHSNGTVHIIGNRVSRQQVYGLMLHEVGVHAGMREMLGDEGFAAALAAVRERAGRATANLLDPSVRVDADDVAASQALERVPGSTRPDVIDEEILAYYVQNAPRNAPLLRRITAGMAAWLYQRFPKIMSVMRPSQEALRQMAVRSLRRYARQEMDRTFSLGSDNDHIGFYSAVERAIWRMGDQPLTPSEIMAKLRAQPGVYEAELADMGLEQALARNRSVTPQELRQIVADRRLYLTRDVSVVRGQKGETAAGAKDVRDIVYRLPSDATGGRFSRTGERTPGRMSVARISTRKAIDGREIMQIESLDSDVHPQNGYTYLRPDVIDPIAAFRQEQLWAAVDGARRPLDLLEEQGVPVASGLPEYQAWRTKRQELLNDIANNGDHVGYTADQMGVALPPVGTPLRNWAAATIRNLLSAASVTSADVVAIPVPRMLKKADPGQTHFLEKELPAALDEVARDLGLEVTTVKTPIGKLGEVDVPAIALTKLDKARLAQAGVPLYADQPGGARPGEPANNLRVKAPGGRTIYVNLARIAADGDIKTTIQKLADRYADEVNAARGGERQSDDALMASSAAVDAWETLRTRRVGEPLGAKESIAARQLWAASAEWVTQIADRYRSTHSVTDRFAFNQALAVHRAIQAEVIGARTETARALRSWSIPVGSTAEKLEQISGILITQGVSNVDDLAGRLARLGADQVGTLDEVVESSLRAKTADVLGEIWRASLLSNPKTHVVNFLSNTSVIALDLAETAIAGAVSRLPRFLGGNPEATDMIAEAAAKYQGVMAAWRAQLKFLHENKRFNPMGTETVRPGDVAGGQTDTPRANAVSAESFGLRPETMAGTTADVVGSVLNTPQALLGGADDFFKGINYQGELYAQAHRIASAEVRGGTLTREAMAQRMADLVERPTEAMQAAARRAAQERTFTTPPKFGGVVSAMFRTREWLNGAGLPIGHFILPFINTPANIMKWTFSRTPAGLMMKDVQRKLRAGGKDAMMAKVQIAMGTMGLSLGWALAANGTITGGGPVEPGERQALQRTGWQPYSLKVGDTYIAYQRFDPIATYLSIASDLQEIQSNLAEGDATVEQAGEVTALAIGAIGNAFLSKTYLQGVSDFNAFLADPGRYGERYLSNIAGSMAGPAGMAELRRQVDPAMRDVSDVLDAIKNRWPGASGDLPVARDLWGRPRMYQSHLGMAYDALSPFAARKIDPTPVDSEMIRLGYYPAMPNRSISVPIAGRVVNVPLRNRPDIYNRMLELSGARALDMANQLVQSPAYQGLLDGPEPSPGTKAFAIETIIQRNREVGKMMAMQEFYGDLQEMARRELAREMEGAVTQ